MNNIARMSDLVIICELRSAWADVECAIRHGVAPSARVSKYISALSAEQTKRAAK